MILIAVLLLLLLIPAAYAGILAAPFVPIWGSDIKRVLQLLPKGRFNFCELGFGNGRVLKAVAQRKEVSVIGFEIQPILFLVGWLRTRSLKNTKIVFGDFFKADLSKQEVTFLYWTEKTTHKVKQLNLKKGTEVISYAFPITGWKPTKINREEGKLPIFVYRV